MMKRIVIIVILSLFLAACSPLNGSEEHTLSLFSMDVYMTLTAYGENAEAGLERASAAITELEALVSATDEGSEIFAVNRDGSAEASSETLALLDFALSMCRRTEGCLDVTVYPLVRAWGFTLGELNVPSDAEIAELLRLVDYNNVYVDGSTVGVEPGMMLDFGAVGKGYAGDLAASALEEAGVASALLDLGGNVQAVGARPDGCKWRVAVRDPADAGGYLGVLELSDCAAVTSGGYERYYEDENGDIYWHIIDPSTGRPADSGLVSVTVVGKSGAVCDALSTALFVMGLERGIELWRASDDFEAVFVTSGGAVHVTEGLKNAYAPSAKGYETVYVGKR